METKMLQLLIAGPYHTFSAALMWNHASLGLSAPFVRVRGQNIAALVRAARVTSTTYTHAANLLSDAAVDDDAAMRPTLHRWYHEGTVDESCMSVY